ncbi:helix-turn-helix domain-containing protein [Variovorax sp. 278MFTsu5.1]|uniref:helix-turn-helix domain-containing protein n=1 Tax=Variovorax sp. 278MFTsu5.1 TaxID=3158366 RepID=UPI003AADFA3B
MDEKIRLSIGVRLREERERLGMSQTAFAELGDVSLRAEQDWERGNSAPKADFLAVAATHGVDVLYVLTGQRTPKPTASLSQEQQALLDNYDHADEEGRAAARRVLSSLAKQKVG